MSEERLKRGYEKARVTLYDGFANLRDYVRFAKSDGVSPERRLRIVLPQGRSPLSALAWKLIRSATDPERDGVISEAFMRARMKTRIKESPLVVPVPNIPAADIVLANENDIPFLVEDGADFGITSRSSRIERERDVEVVAEIGEEPYVRRGLRAELITPNPELTERTRRQRRLGRVTAAEYGYHIGH